MARVNQKKPCIAKRGLRAFKVLVVMPVMQFREVWVIMDEGQVLVRVRMWLPNKSLSVMPVVVMIFVLMNMVML